MGIIDLVRVEPAYEPPKLTKDGRLRAPRFKLMHRRAGWRIPMLFQAGFFGLACWVTKRQYDRFTYVTPQQKFLQRLEVAPYGVLGTKMKGSGTLTQIGAPPDADTCIVDPAGLQYIKNGTKGAGGASASIYKFIGLSGAFPEDVSGAIFRATDAKFHAYKGGEHKVVHVVGPDFRDGTWSKREAALELSRAYRNVLHEWVLSETKTLRLLPISSGIFAGTLSDELTPLTHEAICVGFEQLHPFDQQACIAEDRRVELCIFNEGEYPKYVTAFDHLTPPNPVIT